MFGYFIFGLTSERLDICSLHGRGLKITATLSGRYVQRTWYPTARDRAGDHLIPSMAYISTLGLGDSVWLLGAGIF
jgi:hypothetical protein